MSQNAEGKFCHPIGQVTEIYDVSSYSYSIDVEMIGKNGEILKLDTKKATGDIRNINSDYYAVPIKAKVNDNIKELRLKKLKIGDNLEQCKYEVKVIKSKV